MILRPSYIEAIAPFIDQPLVKILAGVRRCGKSTIFEMLADELRRRGGAGGPNHQEALYRNGYSGGYFRQGHVR